MYEVAAEHEMKMDQGTLRLNQSVVNAENRMVIWGWGRHSCWAQCSIVAAVVLALAGHTLVLYQWAWEFQPCCW